MLRSIRDGFLGLAYPQQCRVCRGVVDSWNDGVACGDCWDDPQITSYLTGTLCMKCGVQLTPVDHRDRTAGCVARVCGMCASFPFENARACGSYSGALEASILFLKANPHISPRLTSLIGQTFSEHRGILESDVVIPIPLHMSRRRSRGFNQAAIIAACITREFKLLLDDRSLLRTRATDPHRAGLDATDRARSVDRAFEVVRPRRIGGASVLLVDDVFTTGSTISAATRSLIDAGARRVSVLTIARVSGS